MAEIKHVEIYSHYNDEETAKNDEFQMVMDADFYINFDAVRIVKRLTTFEGYGTDHVEMHREEETYEVPYDAVMELVFDDIENCYHYLNALAVGIDGDHLNYMEVELKTIE